MTFKSKLSELHKLLVNRFLKLSDLYYENPPQHTALSILYIEGWVWKRVLSAFLLHRTWNSFDFSPWCIQVLCTWFIPAY